MEKSKKSRGGADMMSNKENLQADVKCVKNNRYVYHKNLHSVNYSRAISRRCHGVAQCRGGGGDRQQ